MHQAERGEKRGHYTSDVRQPGQVRGGSEASRGDLNDCEYSCHMSVINRETCPRNPVMTDLNVESNSQKKSN